MTQTKQPIWKLLANLGDVNPIDHGGYFIFEDETGEYPAEALLLEVIERSRNGIEENDVSWEVYRFILEPCTYIDYILSDNPCHKDHPAWFAKDLHAVVKTSGRELRAINLQFCSPEALERADAYRLLGEYHGWVNLDQYPLTFSNRGAIHAFLKAAGAI